MQSVSSRIWTRVAVSISYDDNDYTTGTSKGLMLVVCERWAGDGNRQLYWPSRTSFSSWLGCSTVGHWGPEALSLPPSLNSASCPQLTPTDSSRLLPGLYSCLRPPAYTVLPLIYTTAFLDWRLDRGSICYTATQGPCRPGNNGNEGIPSIPQASLSDGLMSYPGYSLGGVLTLCRDAVRSYLNSEGIHRRVGITFQC